MSRQLLYLSALFVVCRLALPAQTGLSSFVHYTTDHGLSNDNIRDVLKDRQGFLWVATQNGLSRFDGHTFRNFFHDPANPNGLADNYVKFINIGPDGSLWVSTDSGVCRIDPVTLDFHRFLFPENLDTFDDNDQFGRVIFDEVGNGWVSAKNALHCFDPTSGDIYSYPIDLTYAGLYTTYYDRTGKIWLVEKTIISYFDTHTGKLRTLPTDTPNNPLLNAAPLHVKEDAEGKLWVTTWFKGLAWYDPQLDSLIDFPDGAALTTTMLPSVNSAGDNCFWLGGGTYGLVYFNPTTGEVKDFPPDTRDPYTHNNYIATAIYRDERSGSLWIGTEAGLEHYCPTALRFDRTILPVDSTFGQFSLVSDVVQDQTDPTGNTYFITVWAKGLFKWDRKKNRFRHFYHGNSGLKNDGLFCAVQDKNGLIWMGTAGVSSYNPRTGQWRHWDFPKQGKNETMVVMSCIVDRDGGLWFGTNFGGLYTYNPMTDDLEQVKLPPHAYNENGRLRIVGMSLDDQGRIWMATYHRPIRLDPQTGHVEVFEVKNIKPEYNGWSDVQVARSGLLYAASHDCLLELDSSCTVLRKFDQQNGMRSNQLFMVEEDGQGRIWVNTSYLLHCFEPETGRFNYYGTADGLFKNAITDALVTMPDGEVFIGFQNAFNSFHPARLRRNVTPPPVAITSMKVMDKERKPVTKRHFHFDGLFTKSEWNKQDTMLVLFPNEKMLTIQFAALIFIQPSRNRYAYKLEGFNEDWVYTDRNFATYTNLDGGEYLFRVKAANNDGVWSETDAHLLVKVIPPFTRRWYFLAAIPLMVGLVLLGIVKYRRQQRNRLEAYRERLARDLHDEMGSTLSSIRFFSEYAKTLVNGETPLVSSVLQRITLSASDLSDSMQDIIWAMKTRNDQLEDLAARMTEFGLRIFEAKNIAFKTHINEGFSGKSLSPEVRRNLYLIFKEAVNNAAKYADATEVELFLSMKKGLLLMKVSDNGQGFTMKDQSPNGGGNGLQNMRKRAEEVRGGVEILTGEDKGTSVEVRVRL